MSRANINIDNDPYDLKMEKSLKINSISLSFILFNAIRNFYLLTEKRLHRIVHGEKKISFYVKNQLIVRGRRTSSVLYLSFSPFAFFTTSTEYL